MVLQTDEKTLDNHSKPKRRTRRAKWENKFVPGLELNAEVILLCGIEGCGRIYNDVESLRRHYRIHAERRHVCEYEGCGKKFMDSTKLRRHTIIHTGERPCVCTHEGCGKAFALPYNLRVHMKTHKQENYHICPYEDCRKRYAFEFKLKSHILAARHERDCGAKKEKQIYPYVCPYEDCDKAYVYEYKLTLHLKRHHPLHNTEPESEIIDDHMGEGRDEVVACKQVADDTVDAHHRRKHKLNVDDMDENSYEIDIYPTKQQEPKQALRIPPLKIKLGTSSNVSHGNINVLKQQWHGNDVHDDGSEDDNNGEDSENTEEDGGGGDSKETEEDYEHVNNRESCTEKEDDLDTEEEE
ncbi:Zinc finger transcription factor yy1 [Thalictrum thalictroides]|uniref:Zinc finger transcription factor yy1 n=1 Tax=Thalictrum thalictroides TaxID=46969 RepID=A0A7J6WD58_THATH|nr:Zinc finger transcription factor yy1 [Thalictrum thalictroides]